VLPVEWGDIDLPDASSRFVATWYRAPYDKQKHKPSAHRSVVEAHGGPQGVEDGAEEGGARRGAEADAVGISEWFPGVATRINQKSQRQLPVAPHPCRRRSVVHAAAPSTRRLATSTGAACISTPYAIHITAPIICIRRNAPAREQKYDDTNTAVAAHPRYSTKRAASLTPPRPCGSQAKRRSSRDRSAPSPSPAGEARTTRRTRGCRRSASRRCARGWE